MRRLAIVSTAILLSAVWAAPEGALAAETRVTGAGNGIYPPGTSFNSLAISGVSAPDWSQ